MTRSGRISKRVDIRFVKKHKRKKKRERRNNMFCNVDKLINAKENIQGTFNAVHLKMASAEIIVVKPWQVHVVTVNKCIMLPFQLQIPQ